MPSCRRASGFTLIELLVVISIIALLMGILFPTLSAVRRTARRTQCMSNMHQWGVALYAYLPDHDQTLPATGSGGQNTKAGTWYNELPSYVGYKPYGEVFPGTPVNLGDVYNTADIWFCPSAVAQDHLLSGSHKNAFSYGMNAVLNGTSKLGPRTTAQVRMNTIRQGSDTVFMSEPYNNQPYVNPNSSVGGTTGGNVDFNRHMQSRANVLFLDAHVATFESKSGINMLTTDSPYYANQKLDLVWGVFAR